MNGLVFFVGGGVFVYLGLDLGKRFRGGYVCGFWEGGCWCDCVCELVNEEF